MWLGYSIVLVKQILVQNELIDCSPPSRAFAGFQNCYNEIKAYLYPLIGYIRLFSKTQQHQGYISIDHYEVDKGVNHYHDGGGSSSHFQTDSLTSDLEYSRFRS